MSTAEKIAALAEGLEADARKATIAEMIAELAQWVPTGTDQEEGWRAAQEFLTENFS